MTEYIERERLLRRFNIDDMMNVNGTLISLRDAREKISNFPAADVVAVVRCKDCIHRDPEDKRCDCGCWHVPFTVDDDDFCSCGERRGDADEPTGT